LCRLAVDQSALALNAPGIAGERVIVANHAMAGNRDGEIVLGSRARHGADRLGRADTPGDFGLGHCGTGRDFLEWLPHAFLESRAADIERQVQADLWNLDETDDPRHQRLIAAVGADEMRLREGGPGGRERAPRNSPQPATYPTGRIALFMIPQSMDGAGYIPA
jgi:hypothetical protein